MVLGRRNSLLRRIALGFAVAAVAAPIAQAERPGPALDHKASQQSAAYEAANWQAITGAGVKVTDVLAQRIASERPLGGATPVTGLGIHPAGVTVPESLTGREFGPARIATPVIIPQSLSQRQFGPVNGVSASPAVSTVKPDGFDWGDAGIGFGIAAAIALLMGGLAMSMRQRGKLATGH